MPINRCIQEMWDSNDLVQLEYQHFVWSSKCEGFARVQGLDTIDSQDVSGVFLVLAIVTVISVTGKFVTTKRWYPKTTECFKREEAEEDNSETVTTEEWWEENNLDYKQFEEQTASYPLGAVL